MFEFLVGYPPFSDETPEAIFKNILNNAVIWPDVPDDMSPEAQDLIRKLLAPEPKQRLRAVEVKLHPFFAVRPMPPPARRPR